MKLPLSARWLLPGLLALLPLSAAETAAEQASLASASAPASANTAAPAETQAGEQSETPDKTQAAETPAEEAEASAPSQGSEPQARLVFDSDNLELEGSLASLKDQAAQGDAEAARQLARRYALNGLLPQADSWATRYIEMLTAKAEGGDTRSMTLLAALYWRGDEFVEQNAEQAAHWLSRAADAGEASAAYLLGAQYTTLGDAQKASEAYAHAYRIYRSRFEADPKDAVSLYWLGYMEQAGQGTEQNAVSGLDKLEKAADLGSDWALTQLFKTYIQGIGVAPDKARAMGYAAKLVEKGQDAAMATLLARYYLNLDGERDPQAPADTNNAEGRRYLDLAVAANQPEAIITKGTLLLQEGRAAEALPYFEQSASFGNSRAMTEAGRLLLQGAEGIAPDSEAALRHLLTAANRYRDPDAAALLADYYKGLGESELANHWVVLASDNGHPGAMLRRGLLHLSPFSGLEWDPTLCYQWWKLGADQGDSGCRTALNIFYYGFIPLMLVLLFGFPLYLNYRVRRKFAREEAEAAAAASSEATPSDKGTRSTKSADEAPKREETTRRDSEGKGSEGQPR